MHLNLKHIKIYVAIIIGLNISTIILGILHNFFGLILFYGYMLSIVIVLTWILNISLIVLDEYKINKNTEMGKKLNLLSYGYIFFQIVAIVLLVAGLFFLNANWFSPILHFILILSGFFGFFVFGSIFSFVNLKSLQSREVWKIE